MPCNYSQYPENWFTEIRPRVLKRQRNRCKFCGVKNYTVGYYSNSRKKFIEVITYSHYGMAVQYKKEMNAICSDKEPFIVIVLTVAHLDHDINNNNDNNLAALCQRCHLTHDAKQHVNTRKQNKLKNQLKLF